MKRSVVFLFLLILTLGGYRASDAQESARELYLEGREHLIEERFEEALAQFQRIVSDFRASDEADDAQYYVGYALSELERIEAALEAYSVLLDRWPDSVRVERARAQRAELLSRRRGEDANDALFREVFDGSSSWSLKRDTAHGYALRPVGARSRAVLEKLDERAVPRDEARGQSPRRSRSEERGPRGERGFDLGQARSDLDDALAHRRSRSAADRWGRASHIELYERSIEGRRGVGRCGRRSR